MRCKTYAETLKDGDFSVSRKRVGNTDRWEMDGIGMYKFRRLDEPEFYCTDACWNGGTDGMGARIKSEVSQKHKTQQPKNTKL